MGRGTTEGKPEGLRFTLGTARPIAQGKPREIRMLLRKTPREAIERTARMYNRNIDASEALGIDRRTFGRLCREYGVETPFARAKRQRDNG